MPNICLTIQYNGASFNGWQKQINTRNTIQEVLEKSLKKIFNKKIDLIGASRTDAGVHAKQQVANFFTEKNIPLNKLQLAINSNLPKSVKVVKIKKVPKEFHSRFDAKEKWYRYTILNSHYPDIFNQGFFYLLNWAQLDISLMKKAAKYLEGKHDFTSFCILDETKQISTLREIKAIRITKKNNYVFIDVYGAGFLHKMVRSFAGTLIDVGRGKISPESIKKILQQKNRKFAGPTAAACGLCLMKIKY